MAKKNNYKSGYEAQIAAELKGAKVGFSYEAFKLTYASKVTKGYCQDCEGGNVLSRRIYIPDFCITPCPVGIVIETKGKFTSEMRSKMLGVIESNPQFDVRLLFMRDNWLTRKKQSKYSDWAKKHGIKYGVGSVPKEWIKEFKQLQRAKTVGGTKPRSIGE